MARQSFFADGLEAFNQRMVNIWQFTPDEFKDDARTLKARINRKKAETPTEGYQLERVFFDILAFFDGMSLHQNHVKSDDLFEAYSPKARPLRALEATLPLSITDADDIPFKAYEDIWHFHSHELMQALEFIINALDARYPLSLFMMQDVPVGLLCFHPHTRQWTLFEANMSTEKTFATLKDLMDDLYDQPDFRDASSLQVELYLPRRALIAARDCMESFTKSVEYHHLKQLTSYKLSSDSFLPYYFTSQHGGPSHFKTCITHSLPFTEDNESVGQFLMTKACTAGYESVVDKLLKEGLSPDLISDSDWPVLVHAAVQGHYEVVGTLLSHGAHVNAANPSQTTALHHAARMGHVKLVKRLITFGADPNIINSKGASPLLIAVKHQSVEMTRLLIAAGARLDICDHFNTNPLLWACRIRSPELVELILKKKRQMTYVNKGGENPLSIACHKNALDIVRLLFRYGATASLINARERNGYSAIHYAILNQNVEMVRILLSHGASAYVNDAEGNTPLHLAITQPSAEITRLILEHETEALLFFNRARKTPLQLACQLAKSELIPRFLEHTPLLDRDLFTPENMSRYTPVIQSLLFRHQYYKLLQICIRHPLIATIDHPLRIFMRAHLTRQNYTPGETLNALGEAVDQFLAEQAARAGCFRLFFRRPPEHLLRLARAINLLHDMYSVPQMEAFLHATSSYMPRLNLPRPVLVG